MAYTKENILTIDYVDTDQNKAKSGHVVADAALPEDAAVLAWVVLCRNIATAGIPKYSVTNKRTDLSFSPTASAYGDVEDKAVFEFKDARGRDCVISVPGPKATCFQADGETINPLDSAVATWLTATLGLLLSAGKVALVKFIRGYRDRNGFRK